MSILVCVGRSEFEVGTGAWVQGGKPSFPKFLMTPVHIQHVIYSTHHVYIMTVVKVHELREHLIPRSSPAPYG